MSQSSSLVSEWLLHLGSVMTGQDHLSTHGEKDMNGTGNIDLS